MFIHGKGRVAERSKVTFSLFEFFHKEAAQLISKSFSLNKSPGLDPFPLLVILKPRLEEVI